MRKIKGFIATALTAALCLGFMPGRPVEVKAAENLIVNGNFEDANNLEVWNGGGHNGGATVTAEVSDTPIGDEKYMTYGKITGRNSNYNCFAFDVTNLVEKNQIYTYSFYVMLDATDYADAPAEQRSVEISPHMRVNGGNKYSEGVGGTVKQTLEPGVWTKFVGTFTPAWNGDLELLVLRFLEQGTNYGSGSGVKGTYYITGVQLCAQDKEPELIQTGIVNLKNAVNKKLGADGDYIVGTAILNEELGDVEIMGLVTKHFNGLTLGNELKPDAIFNYNLNKIPETETITFNGEEMVVPKMDFTRAERTLDYIYKWNEQNPGKEIKIRGHVLVWHSQTPDWFFCENYDPSKALVSAETMTKRLEWYIASVAEHFTGENSKYKNMFYAWDVVNEAVSDDGSIRSGSSKWWDVYQSNEFIIQAFRFANKYMPESVDLYYNDYNEWYAKKVTGIVQLIKDIKATEGTRIDGMGMQGHHKVGGASITQFEDAVRAYAEVVDQVQITEWDMKNSSIYIGTEQGIQEEYVRQANVYYEYYQAIQKLRAEGINFSGMTFWGVIDTNSWLQTSSSVGGGADGKATQHPLLFDGGYQVKPCFWAFADTARYLKAVGATPTPAPTKAPKETPVPTEAPASTEAPAETPVPTNAPATEAPASEAGGVNGGVIAAVVAVLLLCVGGFVILKKKRG